MKFGPSERTMFFPDYTTYTTETSDGTNIYTTVLTDGSTTGGPAVRVPHGLHSYPYRVRHEHDWYGGRHDDRATPMCGMLPQRSEQSATHAADDVGFDSYGAGTIICSVVGTWCGSSPVQLFMYHATANYAYSNWDDGECIYNLSCPNGNDKASCGVQVPQVHWPLPGINGGACTKFFWVKRFVVAGDCIPIGKSTPAQTAINCN